MASKDKSKLSIPFPVFIWVKYSELTGMLLSINLIFFNVPVSPYPPIVASNISKFFLLAVTHHYQFQE